MEHNSPVISKRIWNIVRVMFFMLRKSISKRKLMLDLNMMMERGKIAGKALGNLLLPFHHHHGFPSTRRHSSTAAPLEYEFSCSNSPAAGSFFPYHLTKRRHNFFACAHAPPVLEDDAATVNAVKAVLEMLNNNNGEQMAAEASPVLPGFGFGRSPMVRQLRITDSPFPLRDIEEDSYVDKAAEEFIKRFYSELKQQKKLNG